MYEGLKDTGIKVVAEKMYPVGTTDFTAIILDAKDKDPDCFMQLSYPDDSLKIHFKVLFTLGDGAGTPKKQIRGLTH